MTDLRVADARRYSAATSNAKAGVRAADAYASTAAGARPMGWRMRVGGFCKRIAWLGAALLLTAAAPAPPSIVYGALFDAVQRARVFPDGKTFADATPRRAPADILADYSRAPPQGTPALRAFVLANFDPPGELPAVNPAPRATMLAHIAALWPALTRPALTPPPGSSAIALPAPYIVPGGRFREIYYWDSYFTMLGLARDGRSALIESMLTDFESLVDRFGRIPNGTRTYYLSRSQPPFLALMADLSTARDRATLARRLAALRREHAFWMAGPRVARMPDGAILNHYSDDRDTPRDESWAEDIATAARARRPAPAVYRDLRAAAESGWDFSSRWLDDPARLETIRTTAIAPVDLNSLLYALEDRIAARCGALGNRACARQFRARAAARRAAIAHWLWVPGEARFGDFDLERARITPRLSAATLYPLFTGVASPAQAAAVARTTRARLLAPGGLRTTTLATGEQWDAPNGWAPLQWIAVDGLERYGEHALARTIAARFVGTAARTYAQTGKMLEKYDVEQARPGGGGEYPTQDGFGWTNGVVRALAGRYALDPAGEFRRN